MSRARFWLDTLPQPESVTIIILALVGANLLFNVIANASFKVSAFSPTWSGFLAWQVVGNLAGFITVLTLTGLLRYVPLSVAFPITTALSLLGVQIVAGGLVFHETITTNQWLGALFLVIGIILIGRP